MTDYWELYTKIGASAGLLGLLYVILKDSVRQVQKPKLKINYRPDKTVNIWTEENQAWMRNVATLDVSVAGKDTAYRCIAKMDIHSSPEFYKSSEPYYTLHWAEVDYRKGSTKNLPDELGPEGRRLDVVFTDSQQNIPGCWISIPLALRGSLDNNQAYLPPGKYVVEISIASQNGKGDTKRYKILSPMKWQYLQMVRLGERFKPIAMKAIGTAGSTTLSGTTGTSGTSGTSGQTSYT